MTSGQLWTKVDIMGKKAKIHVTARIKQSSKEFIEAYSEENEMSESECIDFLVSKGIDFIDKKPTKKPEKSSRFVKPDIKEVYEYFFMKLQSQEQAKNEAENFMDYYENVGWKVGKSRTQMKDWKGAVRNWLKRNFNGTSKRKETNSTEKRVQKFSKLATMFDEGGSS